MSETKRGRFIVFEGIDGAGKTTQINLLAKQQNIPEIQKYIKKFSEEFDIFIHATDKWKKGLIDD